MRLVYWNNVPTPYMDERFACIKNLLGDNFAAAYTLKGAKSHGWKIGSPRYQVIHSGATAPSLANDATLILKILKYRPTHVVALHAERVAPLLALLGRFLGFYVIFWTVTTFDTWIKRSKAKEWAKRFVFRLGSGVVSPGADGIAYARKYHRQVAAAVVPHSIDLVHFASPQMPGFRRAARRAILTNNQANGTIFLYVGRIIRDKGLFEMASGFSRSSAAGSGTLVFVGDGKDQEELRQYCSNMGIDTRFDRFQQRADLLDFYALADYFVFPTLGDPYGLVIDEALQGGCPVLTSPAAGELRGRISDGFNGRIAEGTGSDAWRDLFDAITKSPIPRHNKSLLPRPIAPLDYATRLLSALQEVGPLAGPSSASETER